jgi:NACalpha-BTF3-like transcription factor
MSNNKEDIVKKSVDDKTIDEKPTNEQTSEASETAKKLLERNEQMKKKKEEYEKSMKQHYISVLMSQTTLTEEEAKERLEANKYNVMEAVRDFMGITNKVKNSNNYNNYQQNEKTTINQGIYNHIRGMMDEASYRYDKQKQMEEKLQRIRESYQERVLEKK